MGSVHFCAQCGTKADAQANFCVQCGSPLKAGGRAGPRLHLSATHVAAFVGLTMVVWGGVWMAQSSLAGVKPSKTYEEALAEQEQNALHEAGLDTPEIQALRQAVQRNPQDLSALRALATTLVDKAKTLPSPPQQLIFDILETLAAILRSDPKDGMALITIADISFNQKVFNKAAEYYQRYLEVAPKDEEARSRYGSALTFLGQFDAAIDQLQGIVKRDPKNFVATAYLAITYFQKGDRVQALKLGERALTLAPNEEAKSRFEGFLESVRTTPQAPAVTSAPPGLDSAESIVSHVRSNSVAGPKFVRHEIRDNGTLALYFKEFPMAAMPPFIRERFLNGIREAAKRSSYRAIELRDDATSAELARIDLAGIPTGP